MDAPALVTESHPNIDAIEAGAWNRLAGTRVPFVRHEFLAALEHAGAVGGDSGWRPCPVTVRAGTELVGALPLYRKLNSWGEFVFDFSWAEAYRRAGEHYYPKLVVATPFTPATGPRLLTLADRDPAPIRAALLAGARAALPEGSSLHVQFAEAGEADWLETQGFLGRTDCQFHWHNHGYAGFEDFLATFTAEKRKKARRERRRVLEAGISFEFRAGAELSVPEWRRVDELHASTFHRHGHAPYLNLAFFTELSQALPEALQVLLARSADTIVATAIFFRGADTLYGRYWGADGDYHSLHFEACYHQGIEYCIREGLGHFEPGTQGEHKLARGFSPALTRSAHWIADPRFAAAIGRYLAAEREAVAAYAADAGQHLPYRTALPPGDEAP